MKLLNSIFLFSNEGHFSALNNFDFKTAHLFVKGVAFMLWEKTLHEKYTLQLYYFQKKLILINKAVYLLVKKSDSHILEKGTTIERYFTIK